MATDPTASPPKTPKAPKASPDAASNPLAAPSYEDFVHAIKAAEYLEGRGMTPEAAAAWVNARLARGGDSKDTRTLIADRHPRALYKIPATRLRPAA